MEALEDAQQLLKEAAELAQEVDSILVWSGTFMSAVREIIKAAYADSGDPQLLRVCNLCAEGLTKGNSAHGKIGEVRDKIRDVRARNYPGGLQARLDGME